MTLLRLSRAAAPLFTLWLSALIGRLSQAWAGSAISVFTNLSMQADNSFKDSVSEYEPMMRSVFVQNTDL